MIWLRYIGPKNVDLFVFCLFVYRYVVFCFNHGRIPTGSFPQNIMKIRLDLAEILRISKLDWYDGVKEKGRRGEGKEKGRNPTL